VALPIQAIRPPAAVAPLSPITPAKTSGAAAFQSLLSDAIARVDQSQQNSKTVVQKFLSGEDEEVHKVALAAQEAEINFDLFMQIRNKVVSAYQEVMRMQM
jgi:flagellar hook-basal body complex protein FliE